MLHFFGRLTMVEVLFLYTKFFWRVHLVRVPGYLQREGRVGFFFRWISVNPTFWIGSPSYKVKTARIGTARIGKPWNSAIFWTWFGSFYKSYVEKTARIGHMRIGKLRESAMLVADSRSFYLNIRTKCPNLRQFVKIGLLAGFRDIRVLI